MTTLAAFTAWADAAAADAAYTTWAKGTRNANTDWKGM